MSLRTKLLASAVSVSLAVLLASCGSSANESGGDTAASSPSDSSSPAPQSADSQAETTSTQSDDEVATEPASKGELSAGSSVSFPPFETLEGDRPVGFEVDLLEEIAKRAGYDGVDWVASSFEAVIPGVASGKIDIGASGITGWAQEGSPTYDVVMKRIEQVSFTTPFYLLSAQLVTKSESLTAIDQLQPGMKVAVDDGSQYYFWAQKNLEPKGIQVVAVKQGPVKFTQLDAGVVDAVIEGTATAAIIYQSDSSLVLGDTIPDTAGGFCWAISRDNDQLREDLNAGLAELVSDGTYKQLYDKYFPGTQVPVLPTTSFVGD